VADLDKQPSQLAIYYHHAENCDVTLPYGLAQKLEYLSLVQVELGRMAADAVRDYKRIYAERKRVYAEAAIAASKDKLLHAELAVSELRLQEADAEAEKVRWCNAVESNKEVINSLKYTLKTMLAENPAQGG
jgi:hypothetical protein